jgi:hypothetical protein
MLISQGFGGWNTPALVSDFLSYIYIIYYSEFYPNPRIIYYPIARKLFGW